MPIPKRTFAAAAAEAAAPSRSMTTTTTTLTSQPNHLSTPTKHPPSSSSQSPIPQRQPRHQEQQTQRQKDRHRHHRPRSVAPTEPVYVLTLLTDAAHHARMTALRRKYFPRHLNKLDAHLTLFHALPAAKLESAVLPALERVAAETAPFAIRVQGPFRLGKRAIALALAGGPARSGARDESGCGGIDGGDDGQKRGEDVYRALLEEWQGGGWLSEQDARQGKGGKGRGRWRGHYTIMNKVDDEAEVERALEEVKVRWRDDVGTAKGLGLWRYERGWWIWEKGFDFTKGQ